MGPVSRGEDRRILKGFSSMHCTIVLARNGNLLEEKAFVIRSYFKTQPITYGN